MILKAFTKKTVLTITDSREPLVSFNDKSGLISFTTGLTAKIKMTSADRVILLQDEYRPRDWYLKVIPPDHNDKEEFRDAFKLRQGKSFLAFNASPICRTIIKSLDLEPGLTYRMTVSPELAAGGIGYPIITASAHTFSNRKSKNKSKP